MLNLILTLITGILVSFYAVDRVLSLAISRNLVDEPDNNRKEHHKSIPILGGLGVLIALSFAFTAFTFDEMPKGLIRTFGGLFALFMIGLRDDLMPSKPINRLIYETLISLVLIIGSDIRFTNMFGLFGFSEIEYWPSVIITWLFIVGLINAYNMIDGIDGLLGIISLFGGLCYAGIFFVYKDYHWAQFCLALSGALIGFLYFNTFPARIFMGDSGSMLLGGAFAIMTLHFLNFQSFASPDLILDVPPIIAICVIAVPVYDMMVVFSIRLINRISPFKADRRHCHHRLIDLGFNHFQSTMILLASNIVIFIFGYYIQLNFKLLTSFIFLSIFILMLEGILIYIHQSKLKVDRSFVLSKLTERNLVLLKVEVQNK